MGCDYGRAPSLASCCCEMSPETLAVWDCARRADDGGGRCLWCCQHRCASAKGRERKERVLTSRNDSLVCDGVVVYGLVGVRVRFVPRHLDTHPLSCARVALVSFGRRDYSRRWGYLADMPSFTRAAEADGVGRFHQSNALQVEAWLSPASADGWCEAPHSDAAAPKVPPCLDRYMLVQTTLSRAVTNARSVTPR